MTPWSEIWAYYDKESNSLSCSNIALVLGERVSIIISSIKAWRVSRKEFLHSLLLH